MALLESVLVSLDPSNTFITRPVLTTVCSLLIENLPDIAPPTVQVSSRYVGGDGVSVGG